MASTGIVIDLERRFAPQGPNQLRLAVITEHPDPGGEVCCSVVLRIYRVA